MIIADFAEDYSRELESRRLIEEQEKIENCYKVCELSRRLGIALVNNGMYLILQKMILLSIQNFVNLYCQMLSKLLQ